MTIKPIYINKKQEEYRLSKAKVRFLQGGRGFGKSTITGLDILDTFRVMPGSLGIIYCKDLKQAKTKEVQSLFDAWKMVGVTKLKQGNPMGCYKFGRPPKGFKIIHNFEDWSNVVSFPDGTCMEFVSERQQSNRGGNYDWGAVLEASLINGAHFWSNIWPMVRGPKHKSIIIEEEGNEKEVIYSDSWRYLSWSISGNMPYVYEGSLLEHFESKKAELKKLEDQGKKGPISSEDIEIIEGTIYDAMDLYGADYIAALKVLTPMLEWAVEYMNERDVPLEKAFYKDFNTKRNTYRSSSSGVDPFHDPLDPMYVSFDFNNTFNSLQAGQKSKRLITVQKEFFNHSNEDYKELVDQYCIYYRYHHIIKKVKICGDWDGWNRFDDDGRTTYYEKISERFELNGWEVEFLTTRGDRNPEHFFKHRKINDAFSEKYKEYPRILINADQCPFSIISIRNARIGKDRKKDKSSEQKLKGEQRKLATDLSDVFDYLVWPSLKKIETKTETITIETFSNMG